MPLVQPRNLQRLRELRNPEKGETVKQTLLPDRTAVVELTPDQRGGIAYTQAFAEEKSIERGGVVLLLAEMVSVLHRQAEALENGNAAMREIIALAESYLAKK